MTSRECIAAAREFLVGMDPKRAVQAEEALTQLASLNAAEIAAVQPELAALAELADAGCSHLRHLLVLHGITGPDYEPAACCGMGSLRA